ncbi:MAG: C39 family peptidase [Candidatus Palauibacterales bacterium]|nr:C39 family peptidase [Candidatus Palauibacterales bacterium]
MTLGGRAASIALAALLELGVAVGPAAALRTPGVGSDTTPGVPVLDVPYVSQTEALCGGAAAVMVMRYWGVDSVDIRAFEPLVDDSARGIRTGVLAREVRALGWRALTFRGSLSEIRRQLVRGRPVIVLLRVGRNRYHYVVVVAADDGTVLVHDPARAPFRRLSVKAFRSMWAPTGAWSLLVVPARNPVRSPGAAGAAIADSAAPRPAADPTAGPERPSALPAPGGPAACHERVGAAVRMASDGDLFGAASLLEATAAACPDSASPLRELSGVRFRQRRWTEAAATARRALALEPGDSYTLGLLAGDLYMAGQRDEALRTWNEVGEPRVSALRVYGLEHVRYRVVSRRVDLPVDSLLTPRRLALVRRRLDAVPGFAATRVDWSSQGAGRADLRVAVLERRSLPGGVPGLALSLAAGLPLRVVRLRTGSLFGDGERWSAAWRWWTERPRVALEVQAPDAFGVTGIWDAGGSWEREAFRPQGASGGGAADTGAAAPTLREERWRAAVSVWTWLTPDLRWSAGLSLDRWTGRGTSPGLSLAAEARAAGDRFRLLVQGEGWPELDGGFGAVSATAGWRTSAAPRGVVAAGRAGISAASATAPLMLWPGAGAGYARMPLLRAHPLLDSGVIDGAAFGRVLAHGGAELDAWTDAPAPLALGAAGFVDVARAWHRPGDGGASPLEVDVGAGLRVALPGTGSRLRVDFAHGLHDGDNVLSVGWESPWPGFGTRSADQ